MNSSPDVPALTDAESFTHVEGPPAFRVLPSFADLGTRGTLVTPLVILTLVSLATATIVAPVLSEGPLTGSAIWVLALLTPFSALAKSVALGGIAWAVLVLLGGAPRFRALLSGVLYAEILLSLQGLVLGVLVFAMGLGPGDGVPSLGLDAWVPATHPVLHALATAVTPFHVAWAVFLVPAVAATANTSRARSGIAVFVLWGLLAALGMTRAFVAT